MEPEYISAMRADLAYVEAELRNIHTNAADRSLNDDEQTRFDEGTTYVTEQRAKIAREVSRMNTAQTLDEPGRTEFAVPTVIRKEKADAYNTLDRASSMSAVEFRDAALRLLDERSDAFVTDADRENAEKRLRYLSTQKGGRAAARHMLTYSTPEYESAFGKILTGRSYLMTAEEQRAIQIGTNTSGGFMVPTHLDPTVILTNDSFIDPLRRISRVVQLNVGNTWNGVTSAGSTASWDGESVEVSDDSAEFANPSIPVHRGAVFARASYEAFQDIAGLAGEVSRELADAMARLQATAHAVGSGSGQPTGIFTALDANTNVEIEATTQGTFDLAQIKRVIEAVPPRFRQNARWVMDLTVINQIRDLGSNSSDHLVKLDAEGVGRLYGKVVEEASEAPNFAQVTTTVDNLLILGDFQQFVLVDKMGATMEFIPNIMGTTNGFPRAERGWFLNIRHGSDSVVDRAFRLLQDGTSA